MAKTVTVTLTIAITGDGLNETHAYQASNVAAPPAVYQPALTGSLGWSSTVYPGMQGILAVPPSPSAVAKVLKGANPDTGIGLNPSMPVLAMLAAGNSLILSMGSGVEPVRAKLL